MVDHGNVINGVTVDPQTLAAAPFTGNLVSTLRRTRITPRIDYQLNPKNTLTVRYAFGRDAVGNAGVRSFNLASQGYHNDARSQTIQATETVVFPLVAPGNYKIQVQAQGFETSEVNNVRVDVTKVTSATVKLNVHSPVVFM